MVRDVLIARGIEFQMTGAAEWKERGPKLVQDVPAGWQSAGQRSEENGLVDDSECIDILKRVCKKGFICYGGKFETYAAVNR